MAAEPLFVSASGALAFGDLRGDAVLSAAARQRPLVIEADAGLEAAALARLLTRLSGFGATDIRLATVAP